MAALVSIITPMFNAEKYILKTFHSIRNQTVASWEWLVVDDGSSDESYQIVSDLAKNDERVKLLKRNRPPKNASTCRNIGIENSKGEFLIFLDADDLLVPSCVENRLKTMAEFPALDFSIFRTSSFKEENDEVILVKELIPNNELSDLENFLKFSYPWTTSSSFWRKSSIEKIGGFDESFNRLQDPEIHIRAILQDFKYKKFATIDSYHRLVYKGIAFPDKAKTKGIYEGYDAFINRILIPNKLELNQEPYHKHIKFSFSGTIRNYLIHYGFYEEIRKLASEMREHTFISELEFKCIRLAIRMNKLGIRNKYLNKIFLYPLEKGN